MMLQCNADSASSFPYVRGAGYFGECGDAHAVTCVDGSCAGSQAECDALAAPCPGQEVCPDGVTCIPEYADGGFQCPGGH